MWALRWFGQDSDLTLAVFRQAEIGTCRNPGTWPRQTRTRVALGAAKAARTMLDEAAEWGVPPTMIHR